MGDIENGKIAWNTNSTAHILDLCLTGPLLSEVKSGSVPQKNGDRSTSDSSQ